MITWKPITEARFYDMLGVLPPASRGGSMTIDAFQLGEASDHVNGRPVFATFKKEGDKFFESEKTHSFHEFSGEFEESTLYYEG